jgi:hypothetical protein
MSTSMSTIAERRRAQAAAVLVLEELSDAGSPATISPSLRTRAQAALRHLTLPDQLHDMLSELLTMVAALPAGATFRADSAQQDFTSALQAARVASGNHSREGFYVALAQRRLIPVTALRSNTEHSSSAITRAVREGRRFFVELDGIRALPAFFLDPRYRVRDLEAVTKQLRGISDAAKWVFFILPKGSLSRALLEGSEDVAAAWGSTGSAEPGNVTLRTPLQAIEDGDIELVLRTAAAYAAN